MKAGVMQLTGMRVVGGIPGSVVFTLDGQVWPPARLSPLRDSLRRRLTDLLARWIADRDRRVARTQLGRIDDRMLRDLGIERDQLPDVVAALSRRAPRLR